jgi:hypothetical protein
MFLLTATGGSGGRIWFGWYLWLFPSRLFIVTITGVLEAMEPASRTRPSTPHTARRAGPVLDKPSRRQQGSPVAATVLLKIVVDTSAPPSPRVRAAKVVLDKAAKAIQLEDIEARCGVGTSSFVSAV